jgi:hypothetical protein
LLWRCRCGCCSGAVAAVVWLLRWCHFPPAIRLPWQWKASRLLLFISPFVSIYGWRNHWMANDGVPLWWCCRDAAGLCPSTVECLQLLQFIRITWPRR